eukprot:scaffold10888_cov19-Tisochrysis_lutea.AAC.1
MHSAITRLGDDVKKVKKHVVKLERAVERRASILCAMCLLYAWGAQFLGHVVAARPMHTQGLQSQGPTADAHTPAHAAAANF